MTAIQPPDDHRPLFPPTAWRPEIMNDRECSVCGWTDGVDNGPALHTRHLGHLTELHHGEPDVADLVTVAGMFMTEPVDTQISTKPMRIWLALDPETTRIHAQAHEWVDGDFPGGIRGARWPRRDVEIDPAIWHRLISGAMSAEEQDEIHQHWWNAAQTGGEPPWPG